MFWSRVNSIIGRCDNSAFSNQPLAETTLVVLKIGQAQYDISWLYNLVSFVRSWNQALGLFNIFADNVAIAERKEIFLSQAIVLITFPQSQNVFQLLRLPVFWWIIT
ncbi:MAG: hypothetical protein CL801_07510 [Citromicrobium sp.]|nr:hypothetical protein [Citromicrobium sp.]